ncbi:MAG: 16S rRNA (adenine(1518)-N(6)/adenine(1519)-N(6))-dimethyltransferase RsmA [Phycisphaerae bacterium]|nr:16S rRNA (adenine(1518)-N(6)/adenine(1519)-N(6))-dimethyltransferase RsmA [Phycisphaerae bacterium]MDD5380049.1 16S rRNA (adenine(1518)-N(6)/adenine(1519)-N(6))-dimethyltransferase RsmA [Phycisphaerae bacterium]
MQTKQQIMQLLASAGAEPNKRLGQNFLIDLNLMRLLVDSANIDNGDIVLEVGCGTGSLTQALAERAGRVIAVELDETLAEIAAGELTNAGNVEVINTDILENKNTINPNVSDAIEKARKNRPGKFLLVSNLPYSIASPLMMNLITGSIVADAMYVTIQKEVAERMTAGPNDRHYGTLSIHMAATGDVKTERSLSPSVFWPQPQVNSAMISFVRKTEKVSRIQNMELLGEVINLFMQHRRKMVKACTKFAAGELTGIDNWPEIFEKCGIDPHNRPEQLRPEDFIAISNLCSKS